MAGILVMCTRGATISCGKCFQNRVALRWWKGDHVLSCSFAIRRELEPQDGKVTSGGPTQPLRLGIGTASQPPCLQKSSTENPEPFRVIYRFPAITACRALSRVKLLQTGITVLILPPVWVLYQQGAVTLELPLYATGVSCFALFMLYAMSSYLRRIIGMMYLSENDALLKVSHLTFWGRRKDIYCPVETVMPLADAGEHRSKVLQRFQRYDTDRFLYFSLRFGQIVDREGFAKVFGDV
ncbi:hypothetical protein JRQ81_010077 [Phrynocephalus forsythii]|uniref:Transmembrane protein 186 n=1 Tax=Phrynocephalus forsythii TaxID=171643 RepID=A0A9Q1ARJ1_9SAUR|nr:hypothetical protein JRQ81_010077 [Phrynocephalus forsythii]